MDLAAIMTLCCMQLSRIHFQDIAVFEVQHSPDYNMCKVQANRYPKILTSGFIA